MTAHKTYTELAPWWPVLTPPQDYDERAAVLLGAIQEALDAPLGSLLELGAATGHLATCIDPRIEVVLNDLRPEMLAVSQELNPEREHVQGDLRTLDLGRSFDAVLIHDVLMYLTEDGDLDAALQSAARHLRPGGVVLLAPDAVLETHQPGVASGGGDHPDGRSARLLEWHHEPDPSGRFRVDFAYLLQEREGSVRSLHESHTMRAWPLQDFFEAAAAAGLPEVTLLDTELYGSVLIRGKMPID